MLQQWPNPVLAYLDGLPDAFEMRHGGVLEPLGRDLDDGRDNIEIYLDERAAALLRGGNAESVVAVGAER